MTKPSSSQGGDGEKTRSPRQKPSARAAESRIPVWMLTRGLHDTSSSSGTSSEQSPDKGSPRRQGCVTWLLSPGICTSPCRPGCISERDWLEAGSSSGAVKQSPVKRLAPGSRPSKMARMQRKTPVVTATVSGIPRRRRSSDDLSRQAKFLSELNISDVESEDDSATAHAHDDMEVDPTSRRRPGHKSAEDS